MLYLSGANRPGLLTALSAALRELGLDVSKAIVETDAEQQKIADKFYVTKQGGGKITDAAEVSNIKRALETLLKSRAGPVTPRPKFTTVSIQQDENKRELLYTLMGRYRAGAREHQGRLGGRGALLDMGSLEVRESGALVAVDASATSANCRGPCRLAVVV